MFTNTDGFRCLHGTSGTLFCGASWFDLHDVTAVQIGFVFEQGDELSPRHILLIPSVMRLFEHPPHVQILDEYGVVLADEPCRNLVLIVQYLRLDVTLDLRHFPALLLVVARLLLLARQFALLALEPFVFVFEVKPVHSPPVRRVDVVWMPRSIPTLLLASSESTSTSRASQHRRFPD
jgi:hypothetical protein